MKNISESDRELFLKVLRKQASSEEIRLLNSRFSPEEQESVLDVLVEENWDNNQRNNDHSQVYEHIASGLRRTNEPKPRSDAFDLFYFFKLAAVFLIFISVSFFLISTYQAPELAGVSSKPVQWITAATAFGEKRKIELPDHSMVYLNYNSAISYPEQFDATSRKVKLEGEAYFEVESDPARPFTVAGERLEVTVLGTSFNFNAMQNQVALDEGKVRVGNAGYDLLLAPGEKAELQNGQLLKSSFQSFEISGWKDGSIHIEDMTVRQMFDLLEKWYGVNIEVEGRLNMDRHFSGNLNNKTLTNILDGLCFTLDCNFRIDEKQINIYAQK